MRGTGIAYAALLRPLCGTEIANLALSVRGSSLKPDSYLRFVLMKYFYLEIFQYQFVSVCGTERAFAGLKGCAKGSEEARKGRRREEGQGQGQGQGEEGEGAQGGGCRRERESPVCLSAYGRDAMSGTDIPHPTRCPVPTYRTLRHVRYSHTARYAVSGTEKGYGTLGRRQQQGWRPCVASAGQLRACGQLTDFLGSKITVKKVQYHSPLQNCLRAVLNSGCCLRAVLA
eukprot:3907473-Rhodomonas_salina.3